MYTECRVVENSTRSFLFKLKHLLRWNSIARARVFQLDRYGRMRTSAHWPMFRIKHFLSKTTGWWQRYFSLFSDFFIPPFEFTTTICLVLFACTRVRCFNDFHASIVLFCSGGKFTNGKSFPHRFPYH